MKITTGYSTAKAKYMKLSYLGTTIYDNFRFRWVAVLNFGVGNVGQHWQKPEPKNMGVFFMTHRMTADIFKRGGTAVRLAQPVGGLLVAINFSALVIYALGYHAVEFFLFIFRVIRAKMVLLVHQEIRVHQVCR